MEQELIGVGNVMIAKGRTCSRRIMLPEIRYVVAIVLLCLAAQHTSAYGRDQSDNVLPPFGHTVFCLQYPLECRQSPARAEFHVTRERLDELWDVNNRINRDIQPVERQTDATTDQWVIDPPRGDCGDYAVTKRHLLLQKGWPAERLLLTEVELADGQHHLILLVRTATTAWVLDNLRPDVPEVSQVRGEYIWVKIETPENPKAWTRSFRILETPPPVTRRAPPLLTNASLTGTK